jgi:AcrR family transcriptional regulator
VARIEKFKFIKFGLKSKYLKYGEAMVASLQSRKRQLVRDAIYEAAIDLFATKGFDETTVEELAEAAGISRRSFFRYFETKDDLLARNTVTCGEVLRKTVSSCPVGIAPIEVVRETVSAGLKFTDAQQRTRQIIEITQRSISARQAHMSRLMEVHDNLSSAYSVQLGTSPQEFLRTHLLAGLTQLVINAATGSWFMGEHKDLSSAAKQAFLELARVFGDGTTASPTVKVSVGRDSLPLNGSKRARSVKKQR